MSAPLIVGIGGTPAIGSTTERAFSLALAAVDTDGARTQMFGGGYLGRLPLYLASGHEDGALNGGEAEPGVARQLALVGEQVLAFGSRAAVSPA